MLSFLATKWLRDYRGKSGTLLDYRGIY